MPDGILICGANGSGKTTLGRELAHVLKWRRMDAEDYYFEESSIPYSKPRSKDAVIPRMIADIDRYGSFVLSSFTGDYGDTITAMYRLTVILSAPVDMRMERIRRRSLEQYGDRVLAGGDMYHQEQNFLKFAETRNLSILDDWIKTLNCPVIRLDGANAISENVQFIADHYLSTYHA